MGPLVEVPEAVQTPSAPSRAREARQRSAALIETSRANCLSAIRLRHHRGQQIRTFVGPIYAMADGDVDHLAEWAGVVLVADDDLSVSESLREVLEFAGHRVLIAGNGIEALSVLTEHDVDVVVLDMDMPGSDGWAVLRQIDDLSRPAVIVYSGTEFSPDDMGALRTSTFDIIRKPSPPPRLLVAIDSALADLRATFADERDRVADERDRVADERDRVADERDRIADARERVGDGRDVLAEGRDVLADHRERIADERDLTADQRDRRADERDRVADERDRAADERDRVADERDRTTGAPTLPEEETRSGAIRGAAAETLIARARAAVSRSTRLGKQAKAAEERSREVSRRDKTE